MGFLLQHLLIKSAKKHPEKEAVVFENESLSYSDLDEITNKLAWVLKQNGVKRGDRVGIYINKSIPSIISIFSILKAGAVYVPLDPNAPLARILYIIDNCDIQCLLTSTLKTKSVESVAAESKSLQTVIFTDGKDVPGFTNLDLKKILWHEVIQYKKKSLPENYSVETDLAYILYTSGSTGVPKGVMISHLNALTFVNWVYHTFEINEQDRFSNHAPLHFDLSILDIFTASKSGGSLVLVPETLSLFPMQLADWIENNKISIWYSVPSALSMMVLHGQLSRHKFKNLKYMFFAGEVFPVKYLRQLMKLIPHPGYINLYGPTETNVITYYETPQLAEDRSKPIPIGKACSNMEVFALTEDNKIVSSPGQKGELIARGSCVAMGYWGDEEKTKEKFITNPTQPHFEELVYTTGDLVTLDENNNYIYVGRKDHMVKSRGYRIEIGEIESVIYTHKNIKEAAVIAIPDEMISNRIMAIVVTQNSFKMNASDLRMFCSEKLPKYMIPEIIEFKDVLPKTSTGKIDKTILSKEYSKE